jgi:hypothetical protein
MNYRNAKHLKGNRIDCEIEHPDHGWIPFTCDPTDTGATIDVVALFDAMAADPATAAYVYAPPEPLTLQQQQSARAEVYRTEADPLFFMSQRGEATKDEWQAKVAEIKARFPYPSE